MDPKGCNNLNQKNHSCHGILRIRPNSQVPPEISISRFQETLVPNPKERHLRQLARDHKFGELSGCFLLGVFSTGCFFISTGCFHWGRRCVSFECSWMLDVASKNGGIVTNRWWFQRSLTFSIDFL